MRAERCDCDVIHEDVLNMIEVSKVNSPHRYIAVG